MASPYDFGYPLSITSFFNFSLSKSSWQEKILQERYSLPICLLFPMSRKKVEIKAF
jgi:hypothetical protein